MFANYLTLRHQKARSAILSPGTLARWDFGIASANRKWQKTHDFHGYFKKACVASAYFSWDMDSTSHDVTCKVSHYLEMTIWKDQGERPHRDRDTQGTPVLPAPTVWISQPKKQACEGRCLPDGANLSHHLTSMAWETTRKSCQTEPSYFPHWWVS